MIKDKLTEYIKFRMLPETKKIIIERAAEEEITLEHMCRKILNEAARNYLIKKRANWNGPSPD